MYLGLGVLAVAGAFEVWTFTVVRVMRMSPEGALAAIAAFPIAALPIYTRLALGTGPTLIHVAALAAITQVVAPTPLFGVQAAAAGLTGAWLIRAPTGRGSIIVAGAGAGVAAAVVAIAGSWSALSPNALAAGAVGAVGGGLIAGSLVLAGSPVLERLFQHVTPLTLIEALSYDHPLLRRLMTRAPGTFLHSTNVAVLADVAAHAIHADSLIARVGALYHDVGKTSSPDAFMENQRDAGDDEIAGGGARLSTDLLLAHVADGVRLVTEHGLGERVADFVREHHGTAELRVFASDGSQMMRSGRRYPGPKPRSRETGLLMLADQVEATARAWRPETLAACRTLIRDVVSRAESSGQLADSALTNADLQAVEVALTDVLHAMHHRRTGYPTDDRGPGANPERDADRNADPVTH